MKILVADDEAKIRRMILRCLIEEGYEVYEASDGQEALEIMRLEKISLVILDLMMPNLDGEGFVKACRSFSDAYIVVLTAKTGEDSQVKLYALGADDYIEKPFSIKALVLKVAAIFSRLEKTPKSQGYSSGYGLSIDHKSHKVFTNGIECPLKPKEYELLMFLVNNQNLALSRGQLLDGVWGDDYFGADMTVDIHISRLRKKLKSCSKHIKTISNYGYKWDPNE